MGYLFALVVIGLLGFCLGTACGSLCTVSETGVAGTSVGGRARLSELRW